MCPMLFGKVKSATKEQALAQSVGGARQLGRALVDTDLLVFVPNWVAGPRI